MRQCPAGISPPPERKVGGAGFARAGASTGTCPVKSYILINAPCPEVTPAYRQAGSNHEKSLRPLLYRLGILGDFLINS
jgi:hypothetical protein